MFTGICPTCSEKLPFTLKAKVKCNHCERFAEADSKQVSAYGFALMFVAAIASMADWRLLILGIPLILIMLAKLKYKVVDDQAK